VAVRGACGRPSALLLVTPPTSFLPNHQHRPTACSPATTCPASYLSLSITLSRPRISLSTPLSCSPRPRLCLPGSALRCGSFWPSSSRRRSACSRPSGHTASSSAQGPKSASSRTSAQRTSFVPTSSCASSLTAARYPSSAGCLPAVERGKLVHDATTIVLACSEPRSTDRLRSLAPQMTVTYQVGGGGHLDIDFWVRLLTLRPPAGLLCSPPADPAARPLAISRSPLSQLKDPQSKVLYSQHRSPTGTYSFTAKIDGRYNYCFSNEMSTVSPKTLSSVPSF
jgi:hypothetical protein